MRNTDLIPPGGVISRSAQSSDIGTMNNNSADQPGQYDALPQCSHYHPASELSKQPGYYPNISTVQLAAASQVMKLIHEEKLHFETDAEDVFLKILRFLRARKYNVKNAMHMIREDVKWRSQDNRLNLSLESAQEVLNCDVKLLYQYFPVWFQGYDKQMRPVSYRQFGKFEIWNVLKLTTMDRLVRFHAWETEQALRSMYELSERSGFNIETFLLVIDASGWSMKLATADAFTFIKGMAVTDSDHYPERLGTMLIINAPGVLSFAWKIIQGFLDSVTKEKIRIMSDPAEWQPVLQQYIDRDQIPMQYGGTAPNLTADEAISAMNPPTSSKGRNDADDFTPISVVATTSSSQSLGSTPAGQRGPPSPTPRLMTEGRNRTPFTPRLSHVFDPASPRQAGVLTRHPGDSSRPLGRPGFDGTTAHTQRSPRTLVDAGTQTDEGRYVLQEEIDRARRLDGSCSVM